MNKTYSEKVARVFMFVSFFMLVPALFGLILSLGLIVISIPIILIFAIGITLLIGYWKHAGGNLDESKVSFLWISTAVYNGIFAKLGISSTFNFLIQVHSPALSEHGIVFLMLLSWWIIAAILAISAFVSNRRHLVYT